MPEKYDSEFRFKDLEKVSRRLRPDMLKVISEEDITFDFSDLFNDSPERRGSMFFLGYYSPSGIKYAFEEYGVFELLEKKGFDNIKLVVDTEDPYRQRLALYFEQMDEDHLIYETVLKRKKITLPSDGSEKSFEVLYIEWITLQNPKAGFSDSKPKLPGQKYPGLALGEIVFKLFLFTCKRLGLQGIINVPEYFHNAHIYSKEFRFISPEYEGKLHAIQRDLLPEYDLAAISWAVELGCVKENGKDFRWFVSEQVVAIDKELKEYFNTEKYLGQQAENYNNNHYSFDKDKWETIKSKVNSLNWS